MFSYFKCTLLEKVVVKVEMIGTIEKRIQNKIKQDFFFVHFHTPLTTF